MRFSREDFTRHANLLCQAFKVAIPPDEEGDPKSLTSWELIKDISNPRNVYVAHPPIDCEITEAAAAEFNPDVFEYEDDTLMDPDSISPPKLPQYIEWRFSFLYSDTWMVPVLYFTVKHNDGMPFQRSQVLNMLNIDENNVTDIWDFLSYEEHPVTGEPSFFLHPCQTCERLSLLFQQNNQQATPSSLLSWMTMILPTIGFRIPTRTFLRLQEWIDNHEE